MLRTPILLLLLSLCLKPALAVFGDPLATAEAGDGGDGVLGRSEADPLAAAVEDKAGAAKKPFERPERKVGRS